MCVVCVCVCVCVCLAVPLTSVSVSMTSPGCGHICCIGSQSSGGATFLLRPVEPAANRVWRETRSFRDDPGSRGGLIQEVQG